MFHAIPAGVLTPLPLDPAVSAVEQICVPAKNKKDNRDVVYWNNLYRDLEEKLDITNKVKEIYFKVIRRFYPTITFLVRC